MIFNILIILAGLIASQSNVSITPWSQSLTEKVEANILRTYEIDDYKLEKIIVSESLSSSSYERLKDNFYSVKNSDEESIGYIYVAQANSMKNVFDYLIALDENYTIVNTKVLIYREQHGRQIGSKRWLSQFTGMNHASNPELNVNVDGISGATISVTNMTKAVGEFLTALNEHLINQ